MFLLNFREKKRRGRDRIMHLLPSAHPLLGINLQPGHILWLGIELMTSWCTGWPSTTELHRLGLNALFELRLILWIQWINWWQDHECWEFSLSLMMIRGENRGSKVVRSSGCIFSWPHWIVVEGLGKCIFRLSVLPM